MKAWPAYRLEDVLRMPWYQFRLFSRIAHGHAPQYAPPIDAVDEAADVVVRMAEWRARHGRASLPRPGALR